MGDFWCNKQVSFEDFLKLLKVRNREREHIIANLNKLKYGDEDKLNETNLDLLRYFHKYFEVDDQCLCKRFINGLSDFCRPSEGIKSDSKTGEIFFFKCNAMSGNDTPIVIKRVPTKLPDKYINITSNAYPEWLYKCNWISGISLNTKQYYLCVQSDNFINQTLINLILNQISYSEPIIAKSIIYQYDAFFCKNEKSNKYDGIYSGYCIIENANGGDLTNLQNKLATLYNISSLDDVLVMKLLYQLFSPLYILQSQYLFIHTDLKARNVFVHFPNNGITKEIDFQIKIADYDKCSIVWNGIKFHNNSLEYSALSKLKEISPFTPSSDDSYFIFNYKESSIHLATEFVTLRSELIYYPVYDTYCILISMLCEPFFYDNFFTSIKFLEIWKLIWFSDDHKSITEILGSIRMRFKSLEKATDQTQYKQYLERVRSIKFASKCLYGYKLKINATEIIMRFLCNYYNIEFKKLYFETEKNTKIKVTPKSFCVTDCEDYRYNPGLNKYISVSGSGQTIDQFRIFTPEKFKACKIYDNQTFNWDYCQ
jgi:hypothetical protein